MVSAVSSVFGFLHNEPVRVALLVGGAAALVCAVVGLFTVMRRQAFAGHALADVSSAGGSAALAVSMKARIFEASLRPTAFHS